jgi:DNA-binding CsgD family transcriptional regulator
MSRRFEGLTDSQRKCLRLVAQGASSKEIAFELNLSFHTVDVYINNAARLIGAGNRREAAKLFTSWEQIPDYKKLKLKPAALATPAQLRIMEPPQPDGSAHSDVDLAVPRTDLGTAGTQRSVKIATVILGRSLPIGGAINDLTIAQRLAVMTRLTLFSFSSVTAILLIAKGTISLLT